MATLAELKRDARQALLKKDLDTALMLYVQIHQADDKDIRSWLKLAELYAKTGKTDEALHEYSAIAAKYAEDGFVVQAIAINKIILRLSPGNGRAKPGWRSYRVNAARSGAMRGERHPNHRFSCKKHRCSPVCQVRSSMLLLNR